MAQPDDAPRLAPEILDHYRAFDEAGRLGAGSGPLEFARTREIVQRRLPAGSLDVVDVGGGTGVHAAWLARDGHRVELVDPVAEHVERALEAGARRGAEFTARLGDARKLSFDDARFDAALLFGPLYHLPEPSDRAAALREAHRVLRPGGIAFVAAISRFASLFTGIRKGYLDDPRFFEIVLDDLVTGRHQNTTADPEYFTTAFFHTPDLLRAELAAAGMRVEAPVAVEGPAWALASFADRWNDDAWRQCYLARLRDIERERCIVEASAHVLAIGTKPG
jgi:ubiquinone/menaquinone biosynthesis C-methylase UbiE